MVIVIINRLITDLFAQPGSRLSVEPMPHKIGIKMPLLLPTPPGYGPLV
jgi:hypothetical protein